MGKLPVLSQTIKNDKKSFTILFFVLTVFTITTLYVPQDAYSFGQRAGELTSEIRIGESDVIQWGLVSDEDNSITVSLRAEGDITPYITFPHTVTILPNQLHNIDITIDIPSDYTGDKTITGVLLAKMAGQEGGQTVININMRKIITVTVPNPLPPIPEPKLILTIPNPQPQKGDKFGWFLNSITSDVLLISAPKDSVDGIRAGSVYAIDVNNGNTLQHYTNPEPAKRDFFGKSSYSNIDNNNSVIISAHIDDTDKRDSGIVYVFNESGDIIQTIENPTPEIDDRFGVSVSSWNDNVIVGAHRDNTMAKKTGSVYVFDEVYNLELTIQNPTPEKHDRFGKIVTPINDDIIVIGAHRDNTGAKSAGSVYLYDESWSLISTINNPTPEKNDKFGRVITPLNNDKIIITAFSDDTYAINAGAAYVYDTAGNLIHTITNPDPDKGDRFGISAVSVGNYIAVGADFDDTITQNAGTVYIFDGITGDLTYKIDNPDPDTNDRFGFSMTSLDENTIAIGAFSDDYSGIKNSGTVYVYEIPQ